MQFNEEFILLSDCRLINDSLFEHFQSLLQFEIILWSSDTNQTKALMKQKRKVRVKLLLKQRTSCGQKFKKLQTVTVPRLYILETIIFADKIPNKYQTNVSNQSGDMRQITDFI